MKFDIIDARIFLAVYRSGNLYQAAAENNVVSTAVSMRMKRLEARFGVSLLERTGRGVRPTLAGDIFAEQCEQMLTLAAGTEAAMAAFVRGESGVIRMHSNTHLLSEYLPRALGPFIAKHPDVKIVLNDRPSLETVPELLDGTVHLGIVTSETDLRRLDTAFLLHEKLVVICPPGLEIDRTANGAVRYDTLLDYDMIGMPDRSAFTQIMRRQANELGREIRFRLHLASFHAVAQLVSSHGGCAVMPISAARRCRPMMPFDCYPMADAWAERDLYLATRSISQLPAYAASLYNYLVEFSQSQPVAADPIAGAVIHRPIATLDCFK